jgi:hypothetical protein
MSFVDARPAGPRDEGRSVAAIVGHHVNAEQLPWVAEALKALQEPSDNLLLIMGWHQDGKAPL